MVVVRDAQCREIGVHKGGNGASGEVCRYRNECKKGAVKVNWGPEGAESGAG